MAGLGGQALLAFPLGGEGIAVTAKPWIVNLYPEPDAINAGLLTPVQFSVRDVETWVDLGTVHAVVGYAKVFSHGDNYFDYLPRTFRGSLFDGPFIGTPNVTLVAGGVSIEKTDDRLQKSVYFTAVDVAGIFRPGGIVAAEISPEIENIAPPDTGPLNNCIFPGIMPPPWMNVRLHVISGVLGLEHGPRNTGLYVCMINTGTIASPVPQLRIIGPEVDGVCRPDYLVPYNWYGKHRYFVVWNEDIQEAEVYVDVNGSTTRIFSTPLFDEFGAFNFNLYSPGSNNIQRHGGDLDIVAAYGQEGRLGSKMTIHSVAVATDVGSPVIGTMLPDTWRSTRRSAELVVLDGSIDPRHTPISPWFDNTGILVPHPDPDAVKQVVGKAFRITKNTEGKSAALFREEPGLLRCVPSSLDPPSYTSDGFLLEATLFATCTQRIQAATGMGLLVFDGQTVYDLALFDDSQTRTLGLLQGHGDPTNINHRYIPYPPVNWSSPVGFRFTVDPRRGKFELYNEDQYLSPAMTYTFNRASLPTGRDYGVMGRLPFIAFGHPIAAGTLGSFDLYSLKYCHVYQAWEGRTEADPHDDADPAFTRDNALLTNLGTWSSAGGVHTISCAANQTVRYWRPASFDVNRGIVLEANLRIPAYKQRSRTGVYLVLADGNYTYMLGFVDTDAGKFACLSQSHNLNGFWEYPGFEGDSARLSFLCDWTQEHRYRIERKPLDGLYVYLDYETEPRLAIKDSEYFGWPRPRPLPDLPPDTPLVGFGHFSGEGGASEWRYLRTLCSTGYEFSARKNVSDDLLVEQLFGTEAVVVAHVEDED